MRQIADKFGFGMARAKQLVEKSMRTLPIRNTSAIIARVQADLIFRLNALMIYNKEWQLDWNDPGREEEGMCLQGPRYTQQSCAVRHSNEENHTDQTRMTMRYLIINSRQILSKVL